MTLEPSTEFAFELGNDLDLSDTFESASEGVHEPLSEVRMVIPKRLGDIDHVFQQVARIEIAGGQGVRLKVIQRHWYKELKRQQLPNQKPHIFDAKLLQGNGSEPTQLGEQVRVSLQTGRWDCS